MELTSRKTSRNSQQGVALILVMLCILILSVLAASIVFSARSEAFASYNYRISTEADYVAKAGLQRAINFFKSNLYVAVPDSSATTDYDLSQYATSPVALYNTKQRPVTCIDTSGGGAQCSSPVAAVVLSVDSSGNFNGNYPKNLTNAAGNTVPTAFKNALYNIALDPLSDASNSGQFTVKATLLEYYTVNNAFYPAINKQPFEVWYIESTGTWNSNVGAGSKKPTSVQHATLTPVYLPYAANALYGMCSILMNGTTCTDSYNSGAGGYGAGSSPMPSPANCVTSSTSSSNALASGAGVGSGGGMTLNGSYVVNGDASYGATPPSYSAPWGCPSASSGISGTTTGVTGSVQPVPPIPQPPMPTFPSCFAMSGYTCSPGPATADGNLGNLDSAWIRQVSGNWKYELYRAGAHGGTTDITMTGSGTSASPYELPPVSLGNSALCLAGSDPASPPIYYDLQSLNEGAQGKIYIVKGSSPPSSCPPPNTYTSYGNAVLNIYTTLTMTGQGITQYGAPASSLGINVYNGGCNNTAVAAGCPNPPSVNLSGNANLSAMLTALGSASLGGGGSGGAFYGSVLAGNITDAGSYAVHYDLALKVLSGAITPLSIHNYNRPKF